MLLSPLPKGSINTPKHKRRASWPLLLTFGYVYYTNIVDILGPKELCHLFEYRSQVLLFPMAFFIPFFLPTTKQLVGTLDLCACSCSSSQETTE